MKMLKTIVSAVLICMMLTACSGGSEKSVDFEPADAVNEIVSTVEMSSMAEVQSDRLSSYIDYDQSKIQKYSLYICGSGGFADEVGIFKMDSEASAKDLEAVVKTRIESRKVDFKDYNPDEYTKLENASIVQKGNYLFYCVTGDNDTAKSIFDKYYNK